MSPSFQSGGWSDSHGQIGQPGAQGAKEAKVGLSHRGERHRQDSSRGGLGEHQVAGDLVVHGQDFSILSTQSDQFWPRHKV